MDRWGIRLTILISREWSTAKFPAAGSVDVVGDHLQATEDSRFVQEVDSPEGGEPAAICRHEVGGLHLLHLSQYGPAELYAKNLPRLMQKRAHNRIDQNSSPCKDLY
ncbi:unnamed protein product [Leptidea sinapis]|uniref:Uncharacterized protein n=1 Tax=Leptidea sinapis TaxID=189913 RepID=A0A5E4QNR8_9NEOP|nr:unnamed protein product [Leptidea sinapis]